MNRFTSEAVGATLFGVQVELEEANEEFMRHAQGAFDDNNSSLMLIMFFLCGKMKRGVKENRVLQPPCHILAS